MMRILLLCLAALAGWGCSPAPTPEAAQPAPTSTAPVPQPMADRTPPAAAEAAKINIAQMVGEAAPSFSFVTTTGDQVTNESTKGKVVLLDFWASWCGPCQEATPVIQKVHEKFKDRGLLVVMVNTFEVQGEADKNARILASVDVSRKKAEEKKLPFTMAVFGDTVAENWGVGGVPTFVLIDREGKVRLVELGFNEASGKKIEDAIQGLL